MLVSKPGQVSLKGLSGSHCHLRVRRSQAKMAAQPNHSSPSQPMQELRLDGKAPGETDYANYFCTYSFLYHQKEMLEDHKRTGTYYQAIMSNRRQFKDKVVLDVGAGSGILAIFAARAGAKKVYAVEATSVAADACKLVAHNKLGHIIEVIQGTVETIELPEKVDILISEWMGYFLLRESMLDSVLVARDKFLKPGGAMYPSHANIYLVPIRTHMASQKLHEFQVDMDILSEPFQKEQKEYYLHTTQWMNVHPQQLLGSPSCFKKYDLHKLKLEELQAPLKEQFTMHVADGGPVEGFCGYFDVLFNGSEENPADCDVKLSTAPDPTGATHWGQQVFYLQPPLECAPSDSIIASIEVTRKPENHRLLRVNMLVKVDGSSVYAQQSQQPRALRYNID